MAAPKFIQSLWDRGGPRRLALLAGVPIAGVLAAIVVTLVLIADGGQDDAQARAASTATPAATATPLPPTPTNEQVLAYLAAIAPTATPRPSAGSAASSGVGGGSTGGTTATRPYVPPAAPRSGPGPILGTDMRMEIPAIGVNHAVYSRTVGEDGRMGDPSGPWQIIWYDFGAWAGLGGYPGVPGANAVFAGHVDYIRVGPAVFYSIRNLQPGDIVTLHTGAGPINYSVEWTAWAGPNEDFTPYVTSTGAETVTLVTCIGSFSAGHYSNRLIVRAVRI